MAITKVNKKNAKSKSDVWYKVLTIVIIVCLVAGLAVAILQPTGLADYISLHSQTAMKTANYRLNNAQFTYMTHTIYNNYYSTYGSYYSIPIDYCKSSAESTLTESLVLYEAAKAAGYQLSAEGKQQIEDSLKSIEDYGKSMNYNLASTISLMYGGKGVKKSDVRKTIELQTLATEYAKKLYDEFVCTDEDYQKQFDDNKNDYLYADYYSYTVKAEYDKDATDEEKTAAINSAKEKAEEILNKVTDSEDLLTVVFNYKKSVAEEAKKAADESGDDAAKEAAAKALEEITMESVKKEILTERHANSDSEADKWIFAETPAAEGTTKKIDADESATIYQIVTSAYKDESNTVTLRYMYVSFDSFTNPEAAKEFVSNVLADFAKSDKKSADDFEAFAKAASTDKIAVSAGSYKETSKFGYTDSKYDEADEWLFSSDRKAGDTASFSIGEEGVIAFYFEETGREAWLVSVDNDLRSAKLKALVDEYTELYPVTINEKAIAKVK